MPRSRLTFINQFAELESVLNGRAVRNVELVMFDIFDTLLFRRCSAETVQRGVAATLGKAIGQPSHLIEDVLRIREQAYADAARNNQENGLDFEAHFDAINFAWVKRLAPDIPERWEELALIAREAKNRFERWACYPNPLMPRLLEGLQKRVKRLIFVSDMYLGEALISELLANCGLRQYFSAGYVSGDVSLTKHSGRLFSYVLQAECVAPEKVLHIGDNAHADGRRAAEKGIRAVVIRERERPIKRMLFDHRHAVLDPRWHGYNAARFVSAAAHHVPEPQIFTLGRDVLGAPFAAFIHGLAEYCLRIKPDAVYFLSREGLLLKDLYDRFVETMGFALPKGGYLCASRLSAATAAMRGYGLREITLKLSAGRIHTTRGMLSLLRLPPEELETLAYSSGIPDLDQPLEIWNSPAFARLVDHPAIQTRAKQLGGEARQALRDYLRTRGFFDAQRVVLVDVGWAGQIQEGLQIALNEDAAPELHVYYLGANRNANERRRGGLKIHADVADMTRYEWAGGATFEFVQLFEVPSRAAHGTVVGYHGGEPMLMTDDHVERISELTDEPLIALLQEGIRDYVRHYSQYAALTGLSAADVMTYARNIIARVIRLPRRGELIFFSLLLNVANFGSDERQKLADTPSLISVSKFIYSISISLWRQGTVALRLGRFAALAHSVLHIPRIRMRLPQQIEPNVSVKTEHKEDEWNPFTPPAHGFEADVERRASALADQARMACPEIRARPALSIFEASCLHIAHRVANAYLALKGLGKVPADLLPLRRWLWREVYICLPLDGMLGRMARRLRHRRGRTNPAAESSLKV